MSQKLAPIDWRTLVKPGIARPVIIQQGTEVPVFIIKNNLRTAGMSRERYFAILENL
jgi:hypothetical protein